MIDSNLTFIIQFLARDQLVAAKEEMKTRSAELQAVISSAGKLLLSGEIEELKFCMKAKIIRQLSPKQKVRIYELLRMLTIESNSENWFSVLFTDIQEFYARTGIKQNLRYSYLSKLTDAQFAAEFDEILWSNKRRTNLFRDLNSPVVNSKGQKIYDSLFEVLIAVIQSFHVSFIFKNKPKKKVYRKGYNDHGSLGSEFSKTLKQQSSDWSLNEEEQRRKKQVDDFHKFLLGLNGWI